MADEHVVLKDFVHILSFTAMDTLCSEPSELEESEELAGSHKLLVHV